MGGDPAIGGAKAERVRVSVVIASELSAVDLRRCLDSLAPQLGADDEVIIAHAGGRPDVDAATVAGGFQVVEAPVSASIPELRYRALERAGGEIVAMTEASAAFAPGWLERLVALHDEGFDAVGGAIDPDPSFGLLSWAAHLCEYGPYLSPLADEEGGDFSGFNASYKRRLLERCTASIRGRHWETILHQEARAHGARFYRCGDVRLVNTRRHGLGSFLPQRFAYGRSYGRVRGRRIEVAAHLLLLVATAGLPALMMYRYARWGLTKGLGVGRLMAATPPLLLFATAWSIGEWLGYLDALVDRLRGRRR